MPADGIAKRPLMEVPLADPKKAALKPKGGLSFCHRTLSYHNVFLIGA